MVISAKTLIFTVVSFLALGFTPLFAEETVTDSSGLIWQSRSDVEKNKTWQQALSHCENLTYAGYSDWRLPNKNELASHFRSKYANDGDYWTSSTSYSDNTSAWYIEIQYHHIQNILVDKKSNTKYVICVR
ncbi:DUF1566 domain-containing protein [bacterium]|nr:DUF1566 domain-containing protein [bacterium]